LADASRASQARLDLLAQQGHPDRKERPAHPDRKERPAHPDRGERPAHPDRGENPVRPARPPQRLQQNRRNKVVSEFTSATQRAQLIAHATRYAASRFYLCALPPLTDAAESFEEWDEVTPASGRERLSNGLDCRVGLAGR